jgi:hypothetical protein
LKAKAERLAQQIQQKGFNWCERCGERKKHLDGHHPWGQIAEKILIFFLVCRACHDYIEGNKIKARKEGWIKYK